MKTIQRGAQEEDRQGDDFRLVVRHSGGWTFRAA